MGWSGVLPVQVPAMDWNLEGCKLQIDDMQRVRVSCREGISTRVDV